jgi:hypothetical protein
LHLSQEDVSILGELDLFIGVGLVKRSGEGDVLVHVYLTGAVDEPNRGLAREPRKLGQGILTS